jgi:tetratricopeptide (TPR) repeat protein
MDPDLPAGAAATGSRSVAAETISGTVTTGDNAAIDARTIALAPGAIPGPAHVSIPETLSNLPRPPVRAFLGRDSALDQLTEALTNRASAVVTQAVYGLGGVGKSELALQYAHAHRADYQLVWWVTAGDAEQIEAGLALLAARLCPEIGVAGTTQDAAGWAMAWLQAHAGWLLVLDNVEDPVDVEPLVAQLSGGHILVTTRRDVGWQRGGVAPVRLDVLDPEAAAEIITARTGHSASGDRRDAAAIAAELGYLPLALDQAAAYIAQTRLSLGAYLAKLQQHPAQMYAASGGGEAQRTVARLWDMTIEAISGRDPGAVGLLYVLAFYAPDSIPRLILGGTGAGQDIDAQLGILASYSMITLAPETVSIHRLVQAVILGKVTTGAEVPLPLGLSLREIALEWLYRIIPDKPGNAIDQWSFLRSIVLHAEKLASRYQRGEEPILLGLLLHKIGIFLYSQGSYDQACIIQESALRISEATQGPEHASTGSALGNLAMTYEKLGRDGDALPLFKRAVQIAEATLGSRHVYTARAIVNLADAYRRLGQAEEALPLHERAMAILEAEREPGHPDIAAGLGNLATIYLSLGRIKEALPLYKRAQQLTEAALGPKHPTTAIQLSNLAATYRQLGRPADALPLSKRALQIVQTVFGQDHDSTGAQLVELAETYHALGRTDKALPLYKQAMEVAQRIGKWPAAETDCDIDRP